MNQYTQRQTTIACRSKNYINKINSEINFENIECTSALSEVGARLGRLNLIQNVRRGVGALCPGGAA